MTDNEIIKALEGEMHLAGYIDSNYCDGVNLSLIKNTLDLINRLQAKNERLQSELNKYDPFYFCSYSGCFAVFLVVV